MLAFPICSHLRGISGMASFTACPSDKMSSGGMVSFTSSPSPPQVQQFEEKYNITSDVLFASIDITRANVAIIFMEVSENLPEKSATLFVFDGNIGDGPARQLSESSQPIEVRKCFSKGDKAFAK